MDEYYSSPLCSTYLYQDEGIEELRHYVLYMSELEATVNAAKEEIRRRELEILNLQDILNKTIKERNEAQEESKKLFLEKIILQQQLQEQEKEKEKEMQQQHLKQETSPPPPPPPPPPALAPPLPVVAAGKDDDESERKLEIVVKIATEKPLPEKGKLLQAVKEAGPLLQTLLLAGPLPQWQHPPPQLHSIDIPPVSISSFNTSPSPSPSPFTNKRLMIDSSSPPPINKFPKVSFL